MNSTTAHHAGSGVSEREQHPGDATADILLVYDLECPACDTYCRFMRVSPSAGRLRLVDAREATGVMEQITEAGLDIDQGMVLKMGGRLYYGSAAIHALALLSTRSGIFNKLNHYVFRCHALSRILYPALRACRNLLLKPCARPRSTISGSSEMTASETLDSGGGYEVIKIRRG